MQKEELKSLAKVMYENLILSIDSQEETSIEQLVNYLTVATDSIRDLKQSDLSSLEFTKSIFENAYEDIASQCLSSYQSTNGRFSEISQEHNQILNNINEQEQEVNIPDITEKFYALQNQMTQEIEKANDIIIQLSTQVKSLENKTNIDSLTSVFNRRALATYLNNLCEEGTKQYDLHMLMLDIDDFKVVNDTFGHMAGDKILIFISKILKKILRDGDKIFRYGGEEFIIILNRIDLRTCMKITNRILELIRANKLVYKGKSINITVSLGTTKYKAGDTPDSLIDRVDKALCLAKDSGKNQIQSVLN